MNKLSKLLTISASSIALIACTTGYAGESGSSRTITYNQEEDSQQAREEQTEERSERRRERRIERRLRSRSGDGGSRIYIGGHRGGDINEFWDADANEDGKVSREEFLDMEDRDEKDANETFDDIDENGDDYIEEKELDDFIDEKVEAALESIEDLEFNFDFDGIEHRSIERAMRGAGRAMRQAERRLKRSHRDLEKMELYHFDEGEMEERMAEHRAEMLGRLDEDDDGTVSRDEFTARNDKAFDELDENGDGQLSEDELSEHSLGPIMMQLSGIRGVAPMVRFKSGGMGKGFKIIERKKKERKEEKEEN